MFKKIKKFINPLIRFNYFTRIGINNYLDDEKFLKKKFYLIFNEHLNLNNPKTFNEKLQWLKLHNRKPSYTAMVDKFAAKKIVSNIIGNQYIIPTLGVRDSFDDINFKDLPNQFVLKCTHDSGGVVICNDKQNFDFNSARKKINKSLKLNYYRLGREWPYKNVQSKIIAERLMVDKNQNELIDYKFFCFNGEPKYCQVIKDRTTDQTTDFFDMNWNHQEFSGLTNWDFSKTEILEPKTFELMKSSAKKLSEGIPFVRIDFYEINGKMYFGEITFFPASGFGKFKPEKWNKIFGDMIKLPNIE